MIYEVGDKVYVSLPEVLAWLGLADTEEGRGEALEAVAGVLMEETVHAQAG